MSSSDLFSNQKYMQDRFTRAEMRLWFYSQYESPAECLPYIPTEGGYQWIYGGPYDARDVLEEEFSGLASEEDIDVLVAELEMECTEWSGISDQNDDFGFFGFLDDHDGHNTAAVKINNHLVDVRLLAGVSIHEDLANKHRQMLFANVIGALEAYLYERFVQQVLSDDEKFRRFVASFPKFKDEKLTIQQIFNTLDGLRDKVKKELAEMIWHRLHDVNALFKATLSVELINTSPLMQAVKIRHDIIHRNGFDKDGNVVDVPLIKLENLIADVTRLVSNLEGQLPEH